MLSSRSALIIAMKKKMRTVRDPEKVSAEVAAKMRKRYVGNDILLDILSQMTAIDPHQVYSA